MVWNRLTAPIAVTIALAALPAFGHVAICEERDSVAPRVQQQRSDEELRHDAQREQLMRFVAVERENRLTGLACYYSKSLDGTLTATGEVFRNRSQTAAHLTLPLGCWVEVKSRATGRRIRVKVNDRGPYVRKFVIDLSQAAAHELGVDVAEDRTVWIRIVALPGMDPLPDHVLDGPPGPAGEEAGW